MTYCRHCLVNYRAGAVLCLVCSQGLSAGWVCRRCQEPNRAQALACSLCQAPSGENAARGDGRQPIGRLPEGSAAKRCATCLTVHDRIVVFCPTCGSDLEPTTLRTTLLTEKKPSGLLAVLERLGWYR